MLGLENLISPVWGLSLIKTGIQSKLGFEVTTYTMIYAVEKEQIFFKVPNSGPTIIQEYTGPGKDKIVFTVKAMCKSKLKEGQSIDIINIIWTKEKSTLEIYITDTDKTKQKLTHNL